MRFKKGQVSEGKFVASLIFLIGFAIVLYVLFIPPADRQQLLSGSNDSDFGIGSGRIELLSESPGFISPNRAFGVVHQLPSVNIFVKKEPKVLNLAQSLNVKRGWFSKSFPMTSFEMTDSDLKKVTLVFSVSQPEGELRILLNGNTFFAQEVSPGLKVIEIPLNLIQSRNTLEFEVSSPGIAFWATNQYVLSDVTLKEEFERIHAEESRQFSVTSEEKSNLQSAHLSYFQFCNLALPEQTAALKIYLNDESVFSGLIRCISTQQTIDLDKSKLVSGLNTLRFILEQGDFTFNEVKVETDSKQLQNPTYLFSLSKEQMDDIKAQKRELDLSMFLEDTQVNKKAKILVNNHALFLDTASSSYKQNIKDYVNEGTNHIQIIPSNSFNLVGLKVVLG